MIDLRRLRVLREVAHYGTVTAAAQVLHFTPSAASQQIRQLERELDVVLLERHSRREGEEGEHLFSRQRHTPPGDVLRVWSLTPPHMVVISGVALTTEERALSDDSAPEKSEKAGRAQRFAPSFPLTPTSPSLACIGEISDKRERDARPPFAYDVSG